MSTLFLNCTTFKEIIFFFQLQIISNQFLDLFKHQTIFSFNVWEFQSNQYIEFMLNWFYLNHVFLCDCFFSSLVTAFQHFFIIIKLIHWSHFIYLLFIQCCHLNKLIQIHNAENDFVNFLCHLKNFYIDFYQFKTL